MEVWCFDRGQQQAYNRIAAGLVTHPNGVAFSKAGELLVADYTDGVVVKIVDYRQSL